MNKSNELIQQHGMLGKARNWEMEDRISSPISAKIPYGSP
jgi:hypothetical protein